mgnify:FL=1
MERDAYLQQCFNEHLLVPRNYQQLSKEEALRHIYEVKQEIEHLHGLSGTVRGKRTPEQTYFERSLADAKQIPQFYAMPKVHKAKLKFRPVISACGSPLEVESKFLDFHLQRVIHLCPAHLKDSAGLIDQLQQLGPLPPNARLITADAVSMYTNIDTDYGLEVMKKWFALQATELPEDFPTKKILRGLTLVMKSMVFQLNETYWLQNTGTTMDLSLSHLRR